MIGMLLLLAALADDPPATTTAPPPAPPKQDSPLVKAAKASGGKNRKPKGKVITNRTVKQSSGKLLTLPAGKPATATPATPPPLPEKKENPVTEYEKLQRERADAAKRVGDAQKTVGDLEAESRRLEQAYYDESDPTKRDDIAKRFDHTKQQLETARKLLSDARDALLKSMAP